MYLNIWMRSCLNIDELVYMFSPLWMCAVSSVASLIQLDLAFTILSKSLPLRSVLDPPGRIPTYFSRALWDLCIRSAFKHFYSLCQLLLESVPDVLTSLMNAETRFYLSCLPLLQETVLWSGFPYSPIFDVINTLTLCLGDICRYLTAALESGSGLWLPQLCKVLHAFITL